MVRPIVVPLDGSEFSARALPLAHAVAERRDAPLHLVRVYEPAPAPRYRRLVGDVRSLIADEDRRRRSAAQRYLNDAARWMTADLAHERVHTALLDGDVGSALVSYAHAEDAALVVMTTHERSALGKLAFGSVATHVFRTSGIPVLVVGPQADADRNTGRFGRVLIPLDGSERSARVLEHAVEVGGKEGVCYTLVRVVEPGASRVFFSGSLPHVGPTHRPEAREADSAAAQLQLHAAALRSRGYKVGTRLVTSTDPGNTIVKIAAELNADLIAMATRGRPSAARFLFGSVATTVLDQTTAPVLVYRSPVGAGTPGDRPANPEAALAGVEVEPVALAST